MSIVFARRWRLLVVVLSVVVSTAASGWAADYRAVALDKEPPKDDIAPEVFQHLQAQGIAVIEGEDRTLCEIWLCKKWKLQPDFNPTLQLLYPFEEGGLIGVIRYAQKGYDFRDQEIGRGVYTLRYGLQPVDGNHVGTSPTRDFFVLLPAKDDSSVEPVSAEKVVEQSTQVSETSHPALLAMQEVPKDVAEDLPTMRHDEQGDWWILQFAGNGEAADKVDRIRVDLVVVGFALE